MPGPEATGPGKGGAGRNGGDSERNPVPRIIPESPDGSDRQDGGGHGGKRAVIAALSANLGIALAKFIAFLITGSASLLAEGVHSVADSGNQVLLLLGRSRARRSETEEHQFGFGAERYFYGFLVALVIFTVGAVFSGYEGIQRIRHPAELTSPVVALVVLAIAIILEGFSLRTAIAESDRVRGRAGWRSFIRHAKAPELPAVLLEDVAALCGLGFALVAVTLAAITHNDRWDGAGSLAIGVLLGCVAVVLAAEMKSLLIGESASVAMQAAIVAAIEAGPDIERVIHLRTLHIGPDTLLVAAKVGIVCEDTAASVVAGIDAAEHRIRAAVPIAELIFLEPDIYRAERADLADPAIKAARRSDEDDRDPD